MFFLREKINKPHKPNKPDGFWKIPADKPLDTRYPQKPEKPQHPIFSFHRSLNNELIKTNFLSAETAGEAREKVNKHGRNQKKGKIYSWPPLSRKHKIKTDKYLGGYNKSKHGMNYGMNYYYQGLCLKSIKSAGRRRVLISPKHIWLLQIPILIKRLF